MEVGRKLSLLADINKMGDCLTNTLRQSLQAHFHTLAGRGYFGICVGRPRDESHGGPRRRD